MRNIISVEELISGGPQDVPVNDRHPLKGPVLSDFLYSFVYFLDMLFGGFDD